MSVTADERLPALEALLWRYAEGATLDYDGLTALCREVTPHEQGAHPQRQRLAGSRLAGQVVREYEACRYRRPGGGLLDVGCLRATLAIMQGDLAGP